MNNFIYVVLLAIFIPLTHFSHIYLNGMYANSKIKIEERVYLPSPELTELVSIGYDNFLADILWLKLIQYFGDTSMKDILAPDIYSLIDNITTLDPRFIDSYIFGAYILVDNKEFDKAATILEKGIKANPKEWYLPYQLGFLYYTDKKNKIIAANYFKKAGDVEGAPPFPKRLAASIYGQLKTDLEIRKELWEAVYNKAKESKDSVNIEKSSKELVKIAIEMNLETINKAILKYSETKKSPLSDLSPLIKDGFIDKMPLDPFNRPYIYNSKTQKAESYPLPWDKK